MTNGEGGRDPEESRVDYVIDRVNTVGTVWLGLTISCAQCHDHKHDPISQKDYYALSAFFDSIDEDGRAGTRAKPYLRFQSKHVAEGLADSRRWLASKQSELEHIERAAEAGFEAWLRARATAVATGHRSWHPALAVTQHATDGARLTQLDDGTFAVTGPNARHEDYVIVTKPDLVRITGLRLTVLPDAKRSTLSLSENGHIILTNLKVSAREPGARQAREIAIRSAVADYQAKKKGDKAYGPVRDVLDDDPRTGWTTRGSDARESRTAVFAFAEPVVLSATERLTVELRHRSLAGYANIRRFRIELTDEVGPAVRVTGATPMERLARIHGDIGRLSAKERDALREQFFADDPGVTAARRVRDLARARKKRYERLAKPVDVMVLKQREQPRTTHVLKRGVWDRKGEAVRPGVPAAIGRLPSDRPADRLALARFLVDRDNPLTARVAVNRYWQMYFGAGLVRTPEDFGRFGERPTHPELLDWLAAELIASGWNIKHVQKLIVTSATYRQSSLVSPELLRTDPENRLLARASRFRLPSWMIRDAALAASGLLADRIGGPPVFPYQPDGVWSDSTMGRFHYQNSVGSDLYRRSIYGFWRRLIAPTVMFDASRRRTCQIRVIRTNTPLHALTLLNDVTFVEAARVLAQKVLAAPGTDEQRITSLVQRVLARGPDGHEMARLVRLLRESRRYYDARPEQAAALVAQGASKPPSDLDAAALAAMTIVASTVLNLDEAITRE